MKKIGILTFWNVPNYGAYMQAYALQKVLGDRFKEYEVYQIPYLNDKHYAVYYSSINRQYTYWFINPKFYINLLKNKKRKEIVKCTKKFLDYYQEIPHENVDIKKQKLDCLVLGSDIIWDYSVKFFGKDRYLFGLGIDAKKKISYAPSFGTIVSGKDAPEYVRKGLKELDYISVREEKSKSLVKEIADRDSAVVLDPTLIWRFDTDKNIVKPDIAEEYVIVYGSFFPDELIKGARDYCKKNGMKLICLSSLDDEHDWCDVIVNQDEINPFEWTGYFKHASAVMTCTYHGLLFGLIFKKKIIFNPTKFIMEKAESLIKDLEMEDVLIKYTTFLEKVNWNWDYIKQDEKLNVLRQNSIDYLDGAIRNE